MENNLENKAKFFAQYWGQKVHWQSDTLGATKRLISLDNVNGTLELKTLSSITDEDANEYLALIGISEFHRNIHLESCKKQLQDDYDDIYKTDYLRSKGYALPYMGLSVETMIEYGWIKLQ